MSDELKPVRCGCGGEAEVRGFENLDDSVSIYICCTKCHTSTVSFTGDQAEANAVEVWNQAMGAKDIEIKERTARVERIDTTSKTIVVYKCLNCGQYTHRTSYSSPVNFCTNCGCRLEW